MKLITKKIGCNIADILIKSGGLTPFSQNKNVELESNHVCTAKIHKSCLSSSSSSSSSSLR
jgi:hypothetical protein